MAEYYPSDQEKKVIEITRAEASEYRDAIVHVTNKVKYKMLGEDGVIQKSRKNYLGKYDKERDEVTGKKKFFYPLTEDMVEVVVQNIDLDSADIQIRSVNPNGFSSALVLRYLVSHFMRRNYFGAILNELLRLFCIDGTIILKNIKNYDKRLDDQAIKSIIVDRTNFLIDPSARDLQETPTIERNILKMSECRKYNWDNVKYLKGSKNVDRLMDLQRQTRTQVPYSEIYERWGEIPKWVFTGKDKDKKDWIPAIAIVSNLFTNPIVHRVAVNKKGYKPYEECRFRKIFGRWDGRGIGEIVAGLQSYMNENINLRLNKKRIAQTGLFKVRKGSGITQQLLNSLVSGGVIPVTRMDDIQELRTSDIKRSSYSDQDMAYTQAQRVTGGWQMGKGEDLPKRQPATTAVLQERGMRTGYNLLQENLGIFLSKVFERHIIPLILETIKDKEVISIIGSPKELKEIDENYINNQLNGDILRYYTENMSFPDVSYIEHLRKIYRNNLKKFHKTRYFKDNWKTRLSQWKYETEVFITGESFNKAVIVRELNDMMMTYSRMPGVNLDIDAIFKEILDLMGLGGSRFLKSRDEAEKLPPALPAGAAPQGKRPPQETEMVGEAVTRERVGR